MSDELGTYSSDAERRIYKRQQRLNKVRRNAEDFKKFEPRKYTRHDENFAARFDAGARMIGGDE